MSFDYFGYMKAYLNKGGRNNSSNYHVMYAFSTPPLEVFAPMSQRVKCPLIPSSHLFRVVEAGLSNGTGQSPFAQ
jgi:hypothetical protein